MSVRVKFSDPDNVIARLGLKPGGDAHRFFMDSAAKRMINYVPYRDKGSVQTALMSGINYFKGQFVLEGPHQAYLYFGKVMAGNPRKPISKDLVYTKSPHPKAGPFYDKRMMQDEGKQLAGEITRYLHER